MSAPRFHLPQALAPGAAVALPAALAHHATRVLRLADGAAITLFTGAGGEYPARLRIDGKTAVALIDGFDPVERESPLALTLVQAWVATDKLDWLVEKAVELGVQRLLFFAAERSVVRLAGDRQARRLAHLQAVAVAACAQCGRNRVPALAAAADLPQALRQVDAGPRFILLPSAAQPAAALGPLAAAALIVGPEGGFAPQEAAAAQTAGCVALRLGPRILRTETAGVAAVAVLQTLAGDLGR